MEDELDRRRRSDNNPRNQDEYRMQVVAKIASEETLHNMFRILGINMQNEDSVKEFISQRMWVEKQMKNEEGNSKDKRKFIFSIFGYFLGGLVAILIGWIAGRMGITLPHG